MAMRKLWRDGDTPQLPPCWRPRYPAPLPQSRSIISSFPARVIGGLVTDGLINSLISASSLPARPPAQVGNGPAGCRDGHSEATLLHPMGAPGELLGEHGSAQHGLAALLWAAHMASAPRHRGAWGTPVSGHGDSATLLLAPLGGAGMPPWQVPAGAGRCPPSWPHPALVCFRNGGGLSAPLCRRITGIAAASEVPATSPTPQPGQQDMGM